MNHRSVVYSWYTLHCKCFIIFRQKSLICIINDKYWKLSELSTCINLISRKKNIGIERWNRIALLNAFNENFKVIKVNDEHVKRNSKSLCEFITGYTRLYNDVSDWGWLYFAVSVPALFLYYEVSSYYRHCTFHSPMLYKNIHFWRHRSKETTWSLMVMHPVECVAMLLQCLLPIYMFPTHKGNNN